MIYALLINEEQGTRDIQLARLAEAGEAGIDQETKRLLPGVRRMDVHARLPAIDMALPALRSLSLSQYEAFVANVQALIDADQRIDLFEWMMQRILLAHLEPSFRALRTARIRYSSLRNLVPECSVTLSILSYVGGRDDAERREIFARGAGTLRGIDVELLPEERCGLRELDQALGKLAKAAGRAKEEILVASATCIAADGEVNVAEAEILRAIADTLGCPMPPLLPGQPLV